ncbi:MAG: GGDEF domain-containing protein [Lachnospiraceae bacterium]
MELQKKQLRAYSKIYFSTSLLHVIFLIVFAYEKCLVMEVFNVFSFFVYITLGCLARRVKSIKGLFLTCFAEILCCSILSSLLCGWSSGFMLYFIGMMPLLFYSMYMLAKKRIRDSLKICLFLIVLFYSTLAITFTGKCQIYHLSTMSEHLLYVINSAVAYAMLIGFLVVFVAKVRGEKAELTQENRILENDANYDALTKLLNRRSLDGYMALNLKLASTAHRKFSVLLCDIDDFKKVNDTYGHECGDMVLVNVAHTLKSALRETDTVFRWGGEEILIMLSEDGDMAVDIAQRCRELVCRSQVNYKDQVIKVTITIGGCSYYDGATKDSLIETADRNMYKGKRNGKNQVVF